MTSFEFIALASHQEIEKIRQAGQLAVKLLSALQPMLKPGMSTLELDIAATSWLKERNATSSLLGYNDYPKSICTNVNATLCNGIPDRSQNLISGDIISITVALQIDGFHGKAERTFWVGEPSPIAKNLVEVTELCLMRGIAEVKPGARIGDIGATIQECAESHGFSVVRDYVGHGIGRQLHAAPQVPNYGIRGKGRKLRPGMVLVIQPIINQGSSAVKILSNQWTVVTQDGQLSAQVAHTVVVTEQGVEILTPMSFLLAQAENLAELSSPEQLPHDIHSKLLKERIVFLGQTITDKVADSIVAQLLFLSVEDGEKDIFLYINSPGGSVAASLAIYDTMNHISSDVATICVGQASIIHRRKREAIFFTSGQGYALPASIRQSTPRF